MLRIFLHKNSMAVLFALCAVLSGPGSVTAYAASGPEEAIRMLQQGIDTKDLALVEQHLDIDGVAAKGLQQMLTDPDLVALAAKEPAISIMLALGGNTAANEALHSLLAVEAREYVAYGVTSGAFAGKPEKNAAPYRGLFSKAFRGGAKDKKVFGPAKQQKGAALPTVATTLADGTKGRAYPLTLRMEKQAGVWRVVELCNAADFFRDAKTRAQR